MQSLMIIAATNTIKADWATLRLAKLFGKKQTRIDMNVTMTISKWRGKSYCVKMIDARKDGER